jgi:hypothetical protein
MGSSGTSCSADPGDPGRLRPRGREYAVHKLLTLGVLGAGEPPWDRLSKGLNRACDVTENPL